MTQMAGGFRPTEFQPLNGYELLKAGDYPVTITAEEAVRNNDNTGGMLKVTMKVNQGHEDAGRLLFHRINLWHADPEVKKKAHQNLTALCYAVGITGVLNDTQELLNKQLIVTIDNTGTYNNVRVVKDMAGTAPGRQPLQTAQPGGFPGAPAQQGGFPAPGGASNPNPFAAPAGFGGAPPPAPFATPAAPLAPAAFPPVGWQPHPSAPGYFYMGQEVKTEAELRATMAQPSPPPAPAASGNPFAAPSSANPFTAPNTGFNANPATGFQPSGQAPGVWPQQ